MNIFNTIVSIDEANAYLKRNHGETAYLEEFSYAKPRKSSKSSVNPLVQRYKFVNVNIMRNFPSNSFESVQKAMNCLFYHESKI